MKTFTKYISEADKKFKPVPDDIKKNFINFSDKNIPDYRYNFDDFNIYYGNHQAFLFDRGNFCIAHRIDMARLTEIINASKTYTNFLTDAKKRTKELEKKYGGKRNIDKEYDAYKVYFEWQYEGIDKRLDQIKKNLPVWKAMQSVAKLAGSKAKKFEYEDDIVELYDINGKCIYKGVYDYMNSDMKKITDGDVFCPQLNMYVILNRSTLSVDTKISHFLIVRK